jgi:hypothetical protein
MERMPLRRQAALVVLTPLAVAIAVALSADSTSSSAGASPATGSTLDLTRLPLGDRKYLTHAKKGYVFTCSTQFQGGGAFQDGPWIDNEPRTWDRTAKVAILGSVRWNSRFSTRLRSRKRRLAGNGLPPHPTGVFPVNPADPAYAYDRNPNSIRSYTLLASLPRNPKMSRKRTCVGGTIGVMKSGVPLYSAFDAGGRDAVAHEVQDSCDGHPQMSGQYHYHSLSRCVDDKGSKRTHSKLVGWALDGFGIYGMRGPGGAQMSTANLDSCHGHTHRITWNGKRRRMYHYHATLDFPYMVSCYRGTPITSATGLGIGGGGGQPPGGLPPGGPPPRP